MRLSIARVILDALLFQFIAIQTSAFILPAASTLFRSRADVDDQWQGTLLRTQFPNDDEEENDFDKLLDSQFFDPSKVADDSPFKWFADLVEKDYETAEALFAGTFLFLMVVLSQELFRFQLYGERYVPFQKGGNGLW